MKRKVNLVGSNTLTVSLPTKWAEQNGIRKGSELECDENGPSIAFSAKPVATVTPAVHIDIRSHQWYQVSKTVKIAYQSGVQQIILLHEDMTHMDDVRRQRIPLSSAIRKLCERFIGLEITSQTLARTELTCFAMTGENGLTHTERRIGLLLRELVTELQEHCKHKPFNFKDAACDRHDTIIKYLHYYLRELQRTPLSPIERETAYNAIMQIDHVADAVRQFAEKAQEHGLTSKVEVLALEMLENEIEFYQLFTKGKPDGNAVLKRYALRKKFTTGTWTVKELHMLAEISATLNTSYVLYEAAVARQFIATQFSTKR